MIRRLMLLAGAVLLMSLAGTVTKAQSFTCDNKSGCQYTPPPGCTGAACNPQWIQDGGKLIGGVADDTEDMLDYLVSEGFGLMFPPIDYFETGTDWEYDPYERYVMGGGDEGWSMF